MKKKLVYATLGLFLLTGFATSGFAQWEKTNWPSTTNYFDIFANQNTIIARTWDTLNGGSTFQTSDAGDTWFQIDADDSNDILSMVILNNNILAGTWDGLISTPVGSTEWTELTPTGIPADEAVCSLEMLNSTLFAGGLGTVFSSADNGDTWTESSSGIPAEARITSFAAIGDAIFAGSNAHGMFVSTDAGANWAAIDPTLHKDRHISQLVTMDDKVYAVTQRYGAFVSSDTGANWTQLSLQNVNCLAVVNGELYAGTDTKGIFKTTDNGENWELIDTDMPFKTRIFSLTTTADNIIAGISDGVWTSPISSIVVSVEEEHTPEMYVLERNYPNPFNPTTTIQFTAPVSGNVTLTIYTVTGQNIRTLIDAPLASGTHQVVWDGLTDTGVKAPTGVYLYELRAGSFRDAKKLLMMK